METAVWASSSRRGRGRGHRDPVGEHSPRVAEGRGNAGFGGGGGTRAPSVAAQRQPAVPQAGPAAPEERAGRRGAGMIRCGVPVRRRCAGMRAS